MLVSTLVLLVSILSEFGGLSNYKTFFSFVSILQCLVLLGKLKALCETKTKIFHDRMTKCREILAPKQVVKLLLWIDENSSTLGSVCPGWNSEQFQSKPPAAGGATPAGG